MKIINNHKLSIKLLSVSLTVFSVLMTINLFVRSSTFNNIPYNYNCITDTSQYIYIIHALQIPDSLKFAGEKVPLNKTYIRESYDREISINTYWHSQTILLIKRANRYFPVIEPILKEYGIPDDFKFLAMIESSLMPKAISPAGAAGIWQFMKDSAKEYGLEVSTDIDERYHLEKATEAACKYLKKAYSKYGSWTLAAAAYNAGTGGIDKQIARQKTNNYYDLLLNEETSRYIFRILALKQILASPKEYGFYLTEDDLYKPVPYFEIEIKETIDDFADFAMEQGVTYRELKELNPWLREPFLKNSAKKSYFIKIPKPNAFIINL